MRRKTEEEMDDLRIEFPRKRRKDIEKYEYIGPCAVRAHEVHYMTKEELNEVLSETYETLVRANEHIKELQKLRRLEQDSRSKGGW